MSLYTVLNIPENADSEKIKQAAQTKVNQIKAAIQERNFMFLGINNDSSEEEYKQAAQQKIKKIKEAYIILSNPKTRHLYDEKLQAENPNTKPLQQEPAPIQPNPATPELTTASPTTFAKEPEKETNETLAVIALFALITGIIVYQFFLMKPNPLYVTPNKNHTVPTRLYATWDGHRKSQESDIFAIAISPDGKYVASGMSDYELVQVRDLETGKIISKFEEAIEIQVLKYHPTQPILAVGTSNRELYLWNYKADEYKNVEHSHHGVITGSNSDGISDIAFNTDGSLLASASFDGSVMVWDMKEHRTIWTSLGTYDQQQPGHRDGVTGIAFSPDSSTIVTGSYDNTVRLWDAKTGFELHVFTDNKDDVWTVDFSPDGRWIASGDEESTICIWDAQTHKLHKAIRGHSDVVAKVIFMPNSEVVISAAHDNNIRFWEVSSGGHIGTLKSKQPDEPYGLVVSPDEKTLISGGANDVLYVWK